MKTVGGFRRTRYRGLDRTGLAGNLVGTAYNLVRMARLMTAETPAPQAARPPGNASFGNIAVPPSSPPIATKPRSYAAC